MIYAGSRGHLNIVQYLIAGIPEPLSRIPADIQNGQALINAAMYAHLPIVQYLVAEALVPASIHDGQALINAVIYGHYNVVEYLLNWGDFKKIQFDEAAQSCRDGQILELLEQYKCDTSPSLK